VSEFEFKLKRKYYEADPGISTIFGAPSHTEIAGSNTARGAGICQHLNASCSRGTLASDLLSRN